MFNVIGSMFNRLSENASKKASFILRPNELGRDTSSADRVTFSTGHRFDAWQMPMHGNYGVFLGGAGMYPQSLLAIANMYQGVIESSPATVGIQFQNISGVKKEH
jgi:hypothetical protein